MTKRDLIGDVDEPVAQELAADGMSAVAEKLRNGVTATWLYTVLRMDRKTAKKRLANCPIIGKGTGGVDLYDIGTAMSYLVKPKFDIADYVKTMNPAELPPLLRKEYWSALRLQQQWEKEAGELWSTEKVLKVLGDAFQHIKNSTQTWADNVERNAGLTPAQYKSLNQQVDAFRHDMYERLIDMPNQSRNESTLADMPMEDDDVLPPEI